MMPMMPTMPTMPTNANKNNIFFCAKINGKRKELERTFKIMNIIS